MGGRVHCFVFNRVGDIHMTYHLKDKPAPALGAMSPQELEKYWDFVYGLVDHLDRRLEILQIERDIFQGKLREISAERERRNANAIPT